MQQSEPPVLAHVSSPGETPSQNLELDKQEQTQPQDEASQQIDTA